MQNIFQCGGFFNVAFMLNPAEYENTMHSNHISLKIYFYKNGLNHWLVACKT